MLQSNTLFCSTFKGCQQKENRRPNGGFSDILPNTNLKNSFLNWRSEE